MLRSRPSVRRVAASGRVDQRSRPTGFSGDPTLTIFSQRPTSWWWLIAARSAARSSLAAVGLVRDLTNARQLPLGNLAIAVHSDAELAPN